MPVGFYYKGKGIRVYKDMVKRYGKKKGKTVFYATANARHLNPTKKDKRG